MNICCINASDGKKLIVRLAADSITDISAKSCFEISAGELSVVGICQGCDIGPRAYILNIVLLYPSGLN